MACWLHYRVSPNLGVTYDQQVVSLSCCSLSRLGLTLHISSTHIPQDAGLAPIQCTGLIEPAPHPID